MVCQVLRTYREVVDTSRVFERNKELERKNREAQAQAQAKTKIEDKGRVKNLSKLLSKAKLKGIM